MTIRSVVLTLVVLTWSAAFSACVLPPVGDAVIRCAAGDVCPDDLRCVQGPDGGTCRPADAPCVVAVEGVPAEAINGTACNGGICVRGACVAPVCGDLIISAGETCDGDRSDCRDDCRRCGDGVVDVDHEACDDGARNSDTDAGACRTDCALPSCGDAVIDPPEACDDGANNSDSDAGACRTDCRLPACGDGVTDPGEVCDGSATCRADCLKELVCGDREVDDNEACDDGNVNPRDGCDLCRRTTWVVNTPVPGTIGADGEVALTTPGGVAVDAVGGIYVADTGAHRVLRLDPDGTVVVFAGTGVAGFSGDGDQAIAAELRGPTDVAVAPDGVIFIADQLNDRIRSVDVDGVIRTFAGGGSPGPGDGDEGPAVLARLRRPRGLAASADVVVVAEETGDRVRVVTRTALPVIDTLVGGRSLPAVLADGQSLTSGRLDRPLDVAFDGDALVIAEAGATSRVRRVTVSPTISVTTIAGGGAAALTSANPVGATQVELDVPTSVIASGGDVFFADQGLRRVLRIREGQVIAVVGNGEREPVADGPVPTEVAVQRPSGIALEPGAVIVVDEALHLVRRASSTGVTTLLGTGQPGVSTEGAAATSVTFASLTAVAEGADGGLYIADRGARRLYLRDAAGRITTVAGTGDVGEAVVGALAVDSPLTVDQFVRRPDGRLVILEKRSDGSRLLEISTTGIISVLASGAALTPQTMIIDGQGRIIVANVFSLLIEDPSASGEVPGFAVVPVGTKLTDIVSEGPGRILARSDVSLIRVEFDVAGLQSTETVIFSEITDTFRCFAVGAGRVFIGSSEEGVVELTAGKVDTVVRPGPGRTGDGGPAVDATVDDPSFMIVDASGRLIVADEGSGTVRRLGATAPHIIETLAGDIHPAGAGVLARASLYGPRALALLPDGRLIAGGASGRLQRVTLTGATGVDVVFGHPSPSPVPAGSPARFMALLDSPTAFMFDAATDALQVLAGPDVYTIDVDGPPENWVAAATPSRSLIGATSVVRLDADSIAVTFRSAHCVAEFDLATLSAVRVLFGTCGSAGFFDGFVRDPGGAVVAPDGSIYLADTGNNRVLRRAPDGQIEVVIGDGSPSSAGQGTPAREFPLQAPEQLALDRFGNLFISSSTTIRMVQNLDGDDTADGDDTVATIFGLTDRQQFPQSASRCLGGLVLDDDNNRLFVADACAGFLVTLDLTILP